MHNLLSSLFIALPYVVIIIQTLRLTRSQSAGKAVASALAHETNALHIGVSMGFFGDNAKVIIVTPEPEQFENEEQEMLAEAWDNAEYRDE